MENESLTTERAVTKRYAALACSLALFSLSGCIGSGNADSSIAVTELASGIMSGIESERYEVIRDHSRFTGLWLEHTSRLTTVPPQPDVDFGEDMVVALFLGTQKSGGYSIGFSDAEEDTDAIVIGVRAAIPGDNCLVTGAATEPFHIATLPQSRKIVAFNTTVTRIDCPP